LPWKTQSITGLKEMGGGLSLPHCCHHDAISAQAAKMISELPACYVQDAVLTTADLDIADASWHNITHDKDLLSRFFDTFFRVSAELGDETIKDAHGTGLKTRSKFIVEVFGDALKMLRSEPAEIDKIVEKHCHHYLADNGLRVPQYILVGQVMFRTFEECENPYWNDDARAAWKNALSVIIKLMVRAGLIVESKLTPEELEAVTKKAMQHANESQHTATSSGDEVRNFSESENSNSVSIHSSSAAAPSVAAVATANPMVYDDPCMEG
jgi:hemoglobin-like flavoprotein